MKTSYVFLAPGFEEIEATTPIDVMRRGGLEVRTISITDDLCVTGANGITLKADMHFADADFTDAEWLICPGGIPGATNLAAFEPLNDLLLAHSAAGGKIAAICAAPAVVLGPLGLLDGRECTCYPGFEASVPDGIFKDCRVVALDNLITANGPSSALVFALAILANSKGEAVAKQVGQGMLFYNR